MIRALYNGASGMTAQQKNIDTIANNIANVNTPGFVKNRALFQDTLYTQMTNPEFPGSQDNLMLGSGVMLSSTAKVYTDANYYESDHALDLAIMGEGFFAVENENGGIAYTRDGSFKVANVNDQLYLVNANGNFVLDENMERIVFDDSVNDVKINENGEIADLEAKIGIVNFINPEGLMAVGGNLAVQTEASGNFYLVEQPRIKQYMLEGSNVSVAEEMTEMIRAQRAYQIASRAVTTADEMEALANNLRG